VRGLGAVFVLLLAAASARAADSGLELTAELSPDPVGIEELATLVLRVRSPSFSPPRADPGFLLDNLEGAGRPRSSQNSSWTNGQASSELVLVWRLQPKALGTARVHAIAVEVDGEVLRHPDLTIEVVQNPPERPSAAAPTDPFGFGGNDPFPSLFGPDPFELRRQRGRDLQPVVQPKVRLTASLTPTEAWVGQQLRWSLAVDTQTDVSAVRPKEPAEFPGFWSRELEAPSPPRSRQVEVGGDRYSRAEVDARALFPLRAGTLRLEPIEFEVLARQVDPNFFGLGRDVAIQRRTDPIEVRVRELPPAPDGFSQVVGTVELGSTLEPQTIESGQAATLRVTVTSDGQLAGAPAPTIEAPPGLRLFPPTSGNEESVRGGRLEATATWSWVVLADRPGEYELPAARFVFFDPAAAEYRTATTRPQRLAVRPPAGAVDETPKEMPQGPVASPAAAPGDAPEVETDEPSRPLLLALFVALAAVAALGLPALLVVRQRGGARSSAELVAGLEAARREPSPREAAKRLDAAWRSHLAERWAVPRSLPVSQWSRALAEAGLSAVDARDLIEFFEELHLLEFAPELADAEAMRRDLLERSARLHRRLR